MRNLTRYTALIMGFGVLLTAAIWARASLVWGATSGIQWVWLVISLMAGVSSLAVSIKAVSTTTLRTLIGIDVVLIAIIWVL